MIYALTLSAAIISFCTAIFVLNFLLRLRADFENTVTWMRSGTLELDRLNQRLERTIESADQSG